MSSTVVNPSSKFVDIINNIDSAAEISADRTHLFNIFNNLIENAIKYSGNNVEIKISSTQNGDSTEILVSDNGNGISSADLKHIFQRFYRGKASAGEQPGMGLGLAYVKLLVDAHGGEINVESVERRGTRFTIRLPQ